MSPNRHPKKKDRLAATADTVHLSEHCEKQLPLPWPFLPLDAQEAGREEPVTVFTLGHSSNDPDAFLTLLRQHGIELVVDVRSAPYSRYAPHFNRSAISVLLDDAGIRYLWAGEALGGRPDDPACYRDGIVRKRNIDYRAMARRPSYQRGVQRLVESAADGPTVMLCSEEDPRRCHRHRLIEPSLRDRGVAIQHIRRDGSVETIAPAEIAASGPAVEQLALLAGEIDR